MARTTINSLGVPAGTITAADLSYPLTDFSSTGIDDNATYSPYNTWSGYVSAKKLTPELIKSGFTSDDLNIHGQSCIVLFPIN